MKMKSNTSKSVRNVVLTALMAAPVALVPTAVFAAPALPDAGASNLTVSNGTASTAVSGSTLNITATDKTILNWGSYDIGSGYTVNYALGSSSAAVLNRVGTGTSTIAGSITSDGKVFLLNANGVIIAPGTAADKIQTAGFYVSTVAEPDGYFQANGKLSYVGSAGGNITLTNATIDSVTKGGSDISLVGTNVVVNGGTYTGNLTIVASGTADVDGTIARAASTGGNLTVTSTGATTLASAGGLTVQNDLTVTSSGSADLAKNAAGTTVSGNASVTATGSVTSTKSFANNGVTAVTTLKGADVTAQGDFNVVKVTTTTGAGSITDTNSVVLGTSSTKGNLTVVAGNNVSANGTDTIAVTGGTLNLTIGNGASADVKATGALALALTVGGGTDTASSVSVATTGNLGLNAFKTGTLTASTTGGTLTQTGALSATTATLSGTKTVSLGTVTADTLSVTSGANIVQSGVLTSSKTATFTAAGAVTLDTQTNMLTKVVVKETDAKSAVGIKNGQALTVGDTTNVAGAATFTSTVGGIAFGSVAADSLSFGSTLSATSAAAITTAADNFVVAGDVSLTGTAVTLGTATSKTSSFGAITADTSASDGAVSLTEFSTLNVGSVKSGKGAVSITSLGAGIIQTGAIATSTSTGTLALKAAGAIKLDKDTNAITGAVSISGATDVTLANSLDTTVSTTATGKVSGVARFILGTGADLTVGAAATTTSDFGTVEFATSGDSVVKIYDANALTLQNSTYKANVAGGSVYVEAVTGDLTIGSGNSLNVGDGTTNSTTFVSTAGAITQTGKINVTNDVTFNAKGALTLTQSGNNFGGLTINVGDNSAVTESGTLRVVAATATGKSLTLTSEAGDVLANGTGVLAAKDLSISAVAGKITATNNNLATGTVTLTSGNGNTSFTNVKDTTFGAVSVSGKASTFTATVTGKVSQAASTSIAATSDVSITGSGDVTLGNIATPTGKLSVTSTGGKITQATGTTLNAYSDSTFVTTNAAITVANAGNSFGKVTLTSGTAASSITESTTLNLASVTASDLTAVSENGSIIDTTSAAAGLKVTGLASFTATAAGANVQINDATVATKTTGGDFNQVVIRTNGNAEIVNAGTTALTLVGGAAGTLVGGTFSATSYDSDILDSGALSITGNVAFETKSVTPGQNDVILDEGNNQFGAITVKTTSGATVKIVENTTLNLNAGSNVQGNSEFTSYGDIITSGTGGSTFNGTVRMNASGKITISNPFDIAGVLTVNAPGVKDLSYLSKSVNLHGLDPVFLNANAGDKGPSL